MCSMRSPHTGFNHPSSTQTGGGGATGSWLKRQKGPKVDKRACQPNAIMAFNERHRDARC